MCRKLEINTLYQNTVKQKKQKNLINFICKIDCQSVTYIHTYIHEGSRERKELKIESQRKRETQRERDIPKKKGKRENSRFRQNINRL